MKINLFLKVILLMSIIANVFFFTIFWVRRNRALKLSAEKKEWPDVQNNTREGIFRHLRISNSSIVFIGTSITEGLPVYEVFQNAKVFNRGIKDNTTSHIVSRIDTILEQAPSLLFLEAGVNDILQGFSDDSILNNFRSILKKCKENNTEVIVTSIMPASGNFSSLNSRIFHLNPQIQALCLEYHVYYIDIFSHLSDNGELNPKYTYDGLHLNWEGYEIWINYIEEIIKIRTQPGTQNP